MNTVDLGPKTTRLAGGISGYDPDKSWQVMEMDLKANVRSLGAAGRLFIAALVVFAISLASPARAADDIKGQLLRYDLYGPSLGARLSMDEGRIRLLTYIRPFDGPSDVALALMESAHLRLIR